MSYVGNKQVSEVSMQNGADVVDEKIKEALVIKNERIIKAVIEKSKRVCPDSERSSASMVHSPLETYTTSLI
jgi:hypothetical protein|nr:hypothetical protein [Mesotoga sp.]